MGFLAKQGMGGAMGSGCVGEKVAALHVLLLGADRRNPAWLDAVPGLSSQSAPPFQGLLQVPPPQRKVHSGSLVRIGREWLVCNLAWSMEN